MAGSPGQGCETGQPARASSLQPHSHWCRRESGGCRPAELTGTGPGLSTLPCLHAAGRKPHWQETPKSSASLTEAADSPAALLPGSDPAKLPPLLQQQLSTWEERPGEPYRHASQCGQDTGEKASSRRIHPPSIWGHCWLVAPVLLKSSKTLRGLMVLQDVLLALLDGDREQLFDGIPGRGRTPLADFGAHATPRG